MHAELTSGDRAAPPKLVQKVRSLSVLWRFARPYKTRIVIAAIALLIASGSFLVVGQGLRQVIDKGFAQANPAALNEALILLLAVILVMSCAVYVRFYLVSWLGERVVADIRREVFGRLLNMSPGWFENARTGEMISRLTSDTTLLEQVVGTSVSLALRNALTGIGSLIMLLVTSVKMTLLVLCAVPLVMGPILLFGRRVRKLARASQDRVADVGSYADEALHEIRTVQAYTHETQDSIRFAEVVEQVFNTARRRVRMRAALITAVIFLTFCGIALVLWVGGHDVLAGKLSPGQLSAFVFYAAMVAAAVGAISEVIGDLQRGAGAAERLLEILASEPAIKAPPAPLQFPRPARGRLNFDRVTFHYPSRPDQAALADFTLTVDEGEKVALVGPSGAGKTTVFQLLLRFYDPAAGTIQLDGVNIRQVDPVTLRQHIALVAQEPAIFATSVRENVRYGRPDASEDDMRRACEAAYATEFVERLPKGFDTYLGERGVRLSGGQRQRLAIARAILSNRPVLLLDEATSALDSESEQMVQRALEHLMQDRTTLIIAHRLATVRKVDRIVIIERGRLIGAGTHDNLYESNALYRRVATLQFGVQEN